MLEAVLFFLAVLSFPLIHRKLYTNKGNKKETYKYRYDLLWWLFLAIIITYNDKDTKGIDIFFSIVGVTMAESLIDLFVGLAIGKIVSIDSKMKYHGKKGFLPRKRSK